MEIKVTTKSVNSKMLFQEINDLILDGLESVDLNWRNDDERELFIQFLNSMFSEIQENDVIEQWKVQCNSNNNKTKDMLSGIVVIDIYYKQRNCLNTTNIKYTLQEDTDG